MSRVLYSNANLLDGEHAARSGSSVIVEDGHILAVGTPESVAAKAYDELIDLEGRTLMPGLVMGHYHAAYRGYGEEGGSQTATAVEQTFYSLGNVQIALKCGYTSLISAGTHYNIDVELAHAIDAGEVVGPRLVSCSRNYMPAMSEDSALENEEVCMARGPEGFSKGVLFDLERGVNIVKIFASGGHGAPEGMCMSADEIKAVVEVARDHGARVRAHVAGKQQILDCLRSGVTIIDHGDEADDECIEAYLEHDAFVLPSGYVLLKAAELGGNTFGFSEDLQDFQSMCRLLPRLVEAGVKLVPGDDFGIWQIPHGAYAQELACYAEHAHISPLELIKWSTLYGGEMTGFEGIGTIAPGKVADLLIVNGDPSADIGVLTRPENIQAVVKAGKLVSGELPAPLAAVSAG
ncbi:MAG: amidohydrolase family protein [Pseudomonadales bacterium]|nr:amidohydrolase family protein [Pseudomonadales bacterium]NIX09110.1 amidohydrolase family protein [Pseudomonadales bacterium]